MVVIYKISVVITPILYRFVGDYDFKSYEPKNPDCPTLKTNISVY